VSLSLLSQVLLAADDSSQFEARPSSMPSSRPDRRRHGHRLRQGDGAAGLGTLIVMGFMLAASRKTALLPGKLQFTGEGIYGFVRNGVAIEFWAARTAVNGPVFWPPCPFYPDPEPLGHHSFAQLPVTSHFAIPVLLAVMVWFIYMIVGIQKHGFFGFFKLMCYIPGIPIAMPSTADPDRVPVEHHPAAVHPGHPVVRQHVRGSHADHHRGGRHVIPMGNRHTDQLRARPAAFIGSLGLVFFELLICSLQAYVFVLLTAIYLESSLADSH